MDAGKHNFSDCLKTQLCVQRRPWFWNLFFTDIIELIFRQHVQGHKGPLLCHALFYAKVKHLLMDDNFMAYKDPM